MKRGRLLANRQGLLMTHSRTIKCFLLKSQNAHTWTWTCKPSSCLKWTEPVWESSGTSETLQEKERKGRQSCFSSSLARPRAGPLAQQGPASLEQKFPVQSWKAGSFLLSVLCAPVGGLSPGLPPGGARGLDACLTWGACPSGLLPTWDPLARNSGPVYVSPLALVSVWPWLWLCCRLLCHPTLMCFRRNSWRSS